MDEVTPDAIRAGEITASKIRDNVITFHPTETCAFSQEDIDNAPPVEVEEPSEDD